MKHEKRAVLQQEDGAERVLLAGVLLKSGGNTPVSLRRERFKAAMAEAESLAAACGATVIETVTAERERPDAALFAGSGKIEEWAQLVGEHEIDLVIFNHSLTPTQERNLEKALQCRVLDRVGLILAIFAQRAQSREGRLQVELAQLSHLAGRLVRGYRHLQSQRGGIGLKGPGETMLETDRRLIARKITALKKQLADVRRQRAVRRKRRMDGRQPVFALVGYTNAGKSTLFNRLTKAGVLAEDRLFATLDTTSRQLYLGDDCSIVLSDTVGFVRDLPHELVAAFSATLEETALADRLIHVVDVSAPDYERQAADVEQVLAGIGAGDIPMLTVYNKCDRLSETEGHQPENGSTDIPSAVWISAQTGAGTDVLRDILRSLAKQTLQDRENMKQQKESGE